MPSKAFFEPINRRQLFSLLGIVAAAAAPTLAHASKAFNARPSHRSPHKQTMKKVVVSF